MKQYLQNMTSRLKLQFNELVTFETAVICIIIFIAYPDIRLFYGRIYHDTTGFGVWASAISLIFAIGMGYSIFHVFIDRKKHIIETYFMGVFAIGANAVAGIAAGIEMLPAKWSFLVIFPIWNILSGVLLIYEMAFADNVVTNENTSATELLVATSILLAIFSIAYFAFRLTWAFTLSVCLSYISTIPVFSTWLKDRFRLSLSTKMY